MDALVSTEWLAAEIGKSDLRVVDATLFLAADKRDALAEFEAAHIPGAVFFDIGKIADTSSPYPSMMPSPDAFARHMSALGIGESDRVVVYDNSPYHSAARAWWMLRVFGARNVALLDGGLAKWKSEGRTLESGQAAVRSANFTATADLASVRSLPQMVDNLRTNADQVVDARSAARFSGSEPEARPGLRAGHIPGSTNLPQGKLFNPDGTWKRGDDLRVTFTAAGVDLDKGVVTTCGSGITAAVLVFGLHLLGKSDVGLYDGSWTEWGSQPDTPIATGAA